MLLLVATVNDSESDEMSEIIRWFEDLEVDDVAVVGGKNASLGEMMRNLRSAGIQVPDGFATTARAYWEFIDANDMREAISRHIDDLHRGVDLAEVGRAIRDLFAGARFPAHIRAAIIGAYRELGDRLGRPDPDVAVRSSATAEDLPQASFAGQQESFLNIVGEEDLLSACQRCLASLFTDRAINYREDHGFDQLRVALSVGVQEMVRSDLAGAGVMFSIDTETGFPNTVLINAAWGLGESVVAGRVDPDEYVVFKPLLDREGLRPVISKKVGEKQAKVIYRTSGPTSTVTVDTEERERTRVVLGDDEILLLARWAAAIEDHYGRPMDIEWAKDGQRDELFIVQARPETVQARRESAMLRAYRLEEVGKRLATGLAIGDAIAVGTVCNLRSADEIDRFEDGAVLVTGATDPDWEPIMKRAAAIVTDHGGRTSHAAIVSRELGVAAVIGTDNATETLLDGQEVTVSCAEGDEGHVYEGRLRFVEREIDLSQVPETRTKVMLNVANPAAAFRWWRLPTDGVGLARIEFIVNNHVKIHPMALVHPDRVGDEAARSRIAELTRGHENTTRFFVERLAYGVARIAAAFWPAPVIVRTSDFKTNEYARLIGGAAFEPHEENPMLGWRGPAATTTRVTERASRSNAGRCAGCATRWASPTPS